MTAMFDPAPLLRLALPLTDDGQDKEVGALLGVADRTVARWRRGAQVSLDIADRVAQALGLHPVNIWPEYDDVDWSDLDDFLATLDADTPPPVTLPAFEPVQLALPLAV